MNVMIIKMPMSVTKGSSHVHCRTEMKLVLLHVDWSSGIHGNPYYEIRELCVLNVNCVSEFFVVAITAGNSYTPFTR